MAAHPTPPSGPGAAPVCYRHPDRPARITCARCERRICPDCMNDASVGHQCPECVAEANRRVRAPRTVFGGRPTAAPYATWTFIGLMVAGYLLQSVNWDLTAAFGMNALAAVFSGEWYRMITAAFLHGGLMHLAFNAFALFVVGRQLEAWLGHVRYVALWVLSALGGSAVTVLVAAVTVLATGTVEPQLSVGASGAVFGLFGAVLVLGRRLGLDTRFVLLLLAVNLVITFLPGLNIAWTAHVGGLLTGLALGAGFGYLPRGDRGRPGAGSGSGTVHLLVAAGWALFIAAVVVASTVALFGAVGAG
ncbi:rhomboid family intramembrane serine protease [Nocardiopsis suaedae]|uniref:Rhomboid family intramembrane serine protease n=1 Tax=Nocardiopsis suaedae TaxID=3018444 RepID=A0ABT4TPB0_9ACTN|nr:rhomboid family intramembrane serine protease [Nocardiopsis suaedae]MDA2806512.1 rhomboid family intramembrane serine protease [Nocardiopsis suaedae]